MRNREEKEYMICQRLKTLGYARERRIRLYGEELRLVSNPEPDGAGFAIEGITRESKLRRMRIPLSVIQVLERELELEAASKSAA